MCVGFFGFFIYFFYFTIYNRQKDKQRSTKHYTEN